MARRVWLPRKLYDGACHKDRYHEVIDITERPCPSIRVSRTFYIVLAETRSEAEKVIEDRSEPKEDPPWYLCPEFREMSTEVEGKPAYRVPLMSEIEQLDPNGHRLVSTFSGCGGSCLGFRMAGFQTLMASEFVDAARETYRANHPGVPIDPRDIRTVKPEEILERAKIGKGELDVLEGSPPCASFSTAGKRVKGWGQVKQYSDTKQRTDDLFFEFARIVEGVKPKVFVAENVSGLVKGTAKGYFIQIMRRLKECGYDVECKLLDAQWLGVPQMRQRTIFMGVRRDLVDKYDVHPTYPSPFPYRYSVKDALPLIGRVCDKGGRYIDASGRPHRTIMQSDAERKDTAEFSATGWVVEDRAWMDKYATGKEWENIAQGEKSTKYINLTKPHPDKPSPTVTSSGGNPSAASVVHPEEKRKFSIGELRRICGFPDDFVLTGKYAQQWERLGRAVPPVMMRAVAEVVRDEILAKIKE